MSVLLGGKSGLSVKIAHLLMHCSLPSRFLRGLYPIDRHVAPHKTEHFYSAVINIVSVQRNADTDII